MSELEFFEDRTRDFLLDILRLFQGGHWRFGDYHDVNRAFLDTQRWGDRERYFAAAICAIRLVAESRNGSLGPIGQRYLAGFERLRLGEIDLEQCGIRTRLRALLDET